MGIIRETRVDSQFLRTIMRILLVEDDSKIASFITKGTKEAGYVVDHASDGHEGLTLALSEPYDTAIIDIMLPKLECRQ